MFPFLALVLFVGACSDTPPTKADGGWDAGDVLDALDGGATENCMPATHPGAVIFVDEDAGTTTVEDAASVPDSIKWKDTDQGRVPVVKVVKRRVSAGMIEVLSYGPCDRLLEVMRAFD